MTDHLNSFTSDRGLEYMPQISSTHGGHAKVHDSSDASGPHVWLKARAPLNMGDTSESHVEASVHLTAEDALKLADQLRTLVNGRYEES